MFSTQWRSSVVLITFQNYISTVDHGYRLLVPIVMNWIGRVSYRLSIIHYMLGSNQATRLPNRKQRSGGEIRKQTLLELKQMLISLLSQIITTLKLHVHPPRSYVRLICEYKLYILQNKKVSTAKDHGENYMKDRPPLVRHLLCNGLLFKRWWTKGVLTFVQFLQWAFEHLNQNKR